MQTSKTEIIESILDTNLSASELSEISKTLHQKFLIVRKMETIKKQMTLRVGQRVRVSNITPKKFSGVTGTIFEMKGKRATITLDEQYKNVHYKPTLSGVPLSCLSLVES